MDSWLLEMINETTIHPVLDVVMVGLSTAGLVALPLMGLLLLQRGHKRLGRALLWALVGSLLFTFIFYGLAMRSRPVGMRLILSAPPLPSFPSGHAALAFAAATVLLLGLPELTAQARWRKALWICCILMGATLISYSRIYLGHHYPSDVLAGMVVGCAVGAAAYGIVATGQSGAARWRWLLWPQVAVVILVTQMAYMVMLPLTLLDWPYSDKVLHFSLFGMVAFWLNLWTGGKKVHVFGMALPLAIVIPLSLAFTEECLQQFSPVRTFDLVDLTGDALGMCTLWWMSERFLTEQTNDTHLIEL